MSYQKKSAVLQELEQAIRRKAQEKSRNKQAANRVLQSSVQRRRKQKDAKQGKQIKDSRGRLGSAIRNQKVQKVISVTGTENRDRDSVSIFSNEQVAGVCGGRNKGNRKLQKLASMVNYLVSSSQKAMKYISGNNFQAQFAVKLYRSDRDNLLNEIRHLSLDDIIQSQRPDKPRNDLVMVALQQENSRLKKDILVLQRQAQRFPRTLQISQLVPDRQNGRLRDTLKRLLPSEGFRSIMDILAKQSKMEALKVRCQEVRRGQLEGVLSALEAERLAIIESSREVRPERSSVRLAEAQAEKQQLQKQLRALKMKLSELRESSQAQVQNETLRKSLQLLGERLWGLARQAGAEQRSGRNLEQLIDFARRELSIKAELNRKLIQKNNLIEVKLQEMGKVHLKLEEKIRAVEQNQQRQGEIEQLRQKLSRTQASLVRKDETLEVLNKKLKEREQVVAEANRKAQDWRLQVQALSFQAEQLRNEIRILQNELKEQQQQKDTKINELQSQKTRLKYQSSKIQLESNGFQSQINRLQLQKQGLIQKLRTTQNEIISNCYADEELGQAKSQIIYLKDRIRSLEQEKVDQQRTGGDNQQRYEDLYQALGQRTRQCLQLENSIKEFRRINFSLQQQLAQVQNQIITMNQQHRKLQETMRLSKLEQQERLSNLTIKNTQTDNESQGNRQKMQQEMIQLKNVIDRLSGEYENVKQQLQNVRKELQCTKQGIQQKGELNRYRMQQYVCLLRKILKGLDIQAEYIQAATTIQELLELGSSKVVAIRKRQRQQESVRRKSKRDNDYDEYLSNLSRQTNQVVTVLFPIDQSPQNQIKQNQSLFAQAQEPIADGRALEEFGDLDQGQNNSMLSGLNQMPEPNQIPEPNQMPEPNQIPEERGLSEFGDVEADRSMISRVGDEGIQRGLSQFGDVDVNRSMISKGGDEVLEKGLSEFGDVQADHSLISRGGDQGAQRGLSEFGDIQADRSMISRGGDEAAERGLSEFGDVQPQGMGQSFLSGQQQQGAGFTSPRDSHKSQENNFEDFNDLQGSRLNSSMMSQGQGSVLAVLRQQNVSEKGLEDFNELQQGNNASMVSEVQEYGMKSSKSGEQLNLDEFGEMQQMNASMVSEGDM